MAQFNNAIAGGAKTLTISGDIASGLTFNLAGNVLDELTIDLTGMANAETLTLTNGTVKVLKVKDRANVTLNINSVDVDNQTTIN